jgi:hypothetical protein
MRNRSAGLLAWPEQCILSGAAPTKLVKAVVVYPLVVQNHFLVVRLACRVNVERAGERLLMSSIRLAKLK